jgi:hypothetical protein
MIEPFLVHALPALPALPALAAFSTPFENYKNSLLSELLYNFVNYTYRHLCLLIVFTV